MITAFDIDLKHLSTLSAGTAAISVHASRIGQSIGLGWTGDMSLTDDELNRMFFGGSGTIGDLLFKRPNEYEYTDNATSSPVIVKSGITVNEVSKEYNVEPNVVIFGRQYSSNAAYTQSPSISSKYKLAHKHQINSQVYEMDNDFLPLIDGWPMLEVNEIVSLGNPLSVTWVPDARNPNRLSHEFDWIGLYRKGDCIDQNEGSEVHPPADLEESETNHVHQCYLTWEYLTPGLSSGTTTFAWETYKVSGEYEFRYFYGDSRDGQGYKCGLQPGTTGYSAHCVLRAKAISPSVTVVKSGPSESMDGVPGIESFQDPEDGAMYVSGF